MATITASVDLTYRRVGVTLSGYPADGQISVWRVHPDGTRWAMRSMSQISGGAAFGWDYEAPRETPVTYVTETPSVASTPIAVFVRAAALRNPGKPGEDVNITPIGKPGMSRERPSVSLSPIGRVTPIILTDRLKAPSAKLVVRTRSYADADALEAVVASGPTLLLLMPGDRRPWQYITVKSIEAEPETPYRPGEFDPDATVAEWYRWTLEYETSDCPTGSTASDPTASYQAIVDTYATYGDVRSAYPTYLDALRGV